MTLSFKSFLTELSMNRKRFSDTAKRLGKNAKLGFEYEFWVPEGSKFFKGNDETRNMSVNDIKTFDELDQHFIILDPKKHQINRLYLDWARAAGVARDPRDQHFLDFVKSSYGDMHEFVKRLNLHPTLDWVDEDEGIIEGEAPIFQHIKGMLDKLDLGPGWKVTDDSSVDGKGNGYGIEVISPPVPVDQALEDAKKVFAWIEENGGVTNANTGFHINLSLPSMDSVDPLKLYLLLGEKHALKSFDRLNNTYSKSQLKQLVNNLVGGERPKEASEMIRQASDQLKTDKNYSVNLSKLEDGYLEFRIAGNKNYHKNYPAISDAVLRFLTVLESSADPAADREDYLKKLYKIFDLAADNTPLESEQDLESLLSDYSESLMKHINKLLSKPGDDSRAELIDIVQQDLGPIVRDSGYKQLSSRQAATLRSWLKKLNISKETLKLSEKDRKALRL